MCIITIYIPTYNMDIHSTFSRLGVVFELHSQSIQVRNYAIVNIIHTIYIVVFILTLIQYII